jgi:hypothetical protein
MQVSPFHCAVLTADLSVCCGTQALHLGNWAAFHDMLNFQTCTVGMLCRAAPSVQAPSFESAAVVGALTPERKNGLSHVRVPANISACDSFAVFSMQCRHHKVTGWPNAPKLHASRDSRLQAAITSQNGQISRTSDMPRSLRASGLVRVACVGTHPKNERRASALILRGRERVTGAATTSSGQLLRD